MIAILIPFGILSGGFPIRAFQDIRSLKNTITWPKSLFRLKLLRRRWQLSNQNDKSKLYHPKLIGSENYLKSHRLHSSDKEDAMTKTNLQFQVRTHIFKQSNLAWAISSARKVYIELPGKEVFYGVSNDKDLFEIS